MTSSSIFFFFFNDTATTEIYTLSLHDALPISIEAVAPAARRTPDRSGHALLVRRTIDRPADGRDRKSTRLNSSHSQISYAVFCLKKKINNRANHLVYSTDTVMRVSDAVDPITG